MPNAAAPNRPPRGRWAPSPSGWIHLGNARTALAAWLAVRSQGGTFVWRLEDLDPPRIAPGAAEAGMEDLAWLGLDWDEGPDVGGPHGPYLQSERSELYEAALAHLHEAGLLFPCRRSRKELQTLATAPHGRDATVAYPAALRPERLPGGWFERLRRGEGQGAAIRFRVDDRLITFHDRLCGEVRERLDETVGDFVLRRRDGLWAYQLAVVVDDLAMGIDDVVRGADLLDSTARQIRLWEALGGTPPSWAHVPLIENARGEKLSKRDSGLTLRSLRNQGVRPQSLVGYLAWSLGLLDRPRAYRPAELLGEFSWQRVQRQDFRLPEDVVGRLRAVR